MELVCVFFELVYHIVFCFGVFAELFKYAPILIGA